MWSLKSDKSGHIRARRLTVLMIAFVAAIPLSLCYTASTTAQPTPNSSFVVVPLLGGTLIPLGAGWEFAIAYTTQTSPPNIEVRTSADGAVWSSPSAGFESSTVPPGIGATANRYLIAWFDSGNTLHTALSPNGTTWEFHATHGSFPVNINSRPAIEYNFATNSWLVAFRQTDGTVVVMPVDGKHQRAVVVPGVTTASPPALAWISDRLVLVYTDSALQLRSLESITGKSWPSGPGTLVTSDGQAIVAEGSPYLNRSQASHWLAVKGSRSTGTLWTGTITVYHLDGGSWTQSAFLDRTDPNSRGPAAAGTEGGLVVADTGNAARTVIWRDGREIGPLDTRTQYEVSLALGPASTNTRALPDLICGPCDRCVSVSGFIDYHRDCIDRAGSGQDFRCRVCDFCIAERRDCRPAQLSDAPGYQEQDIVHEPCNICPPP
jgi:hypothetical protein